MRLLVVEDEEKLALSLKKALESETYAVDVCFDGEAAYEKATIEEYDLILLDLGLPRIDGISLSKLLRSEEIKTRGRSHVPLSLKFHSADDPNVPNLNSPTTSNKSKPSAAKNLSFLLIVTG